jgi:TolA-binding protein
MSLLALLPAIAAPKRDDARLEARIQGLEDRIRDLEARAARNDYLAQFQQMQALGMHLQQVYNCVPARGDLLRR